LSVRRRKLKHGYRWWFDRTIKGTRIFSPCIYLTKMEAERAEADALAEFLRTGQVSPISAQSSAQPETVLDLLKAWVAWLSLHRSPRHTRDMEGVFARACEIAPELAVLPALSLTPTQVETWGERWMVDLRKRGKGAGEVNKFLVGGTTAYNRRGGSWGRRRGAPDFSPNPFEAVDRFSVIKGAKYVPTEHEVNAIRLAAGGEFRLYLELLIQTGARPSEGLSLPWADVGPDWVILRTRKTGTGDLLPRKIGIDADLAARFRSWRRAQIKTKGGKLFVFEQADTAAPHHYIWPRMQHRAACKRAGTEYFSVGCYRHFHAVTYYGQTKDLLAVQARLGHRNAKTTQHYLASLIRG
jgi:integrase